MSRHHQARCSAPWRTTPGRAALVAVAVVAVLTTSCQRVRVTAYDAGHRSNLAMRYLTRDGTDRYVLTAKPGSLRIDAPTTNHGTGDGSNTRAIIWPPSTKAATDGESCATWTDAAGHLAQQGLILRLRIDGTRLRTILVAKNVLFGQEWQFNVMTWDSARPKVLIAEGKVVLSTPFEADGRPRPLPWRVCARVEGQTVTVKGWRVEESEPTWSSPSHTGKVRLSPAWIYAGKSGWYAGHVPAGGTIGMSELRTARWELRPSDTATVRTGS